MKKHFFYSILFALSAYLCFLAACGSGDIVDISSQGSPEWEEIKKTMENLTDGNSLIAKCQDPAQVESTDCPQVYSSSAAAEPPPEGDGEGDNGDGEGDNGDGEGGNGDGEGGNGDGEGGNGDGEGGNDDGTSSSSNNNNSGNSSSSINNNSGNSSSSVNNNSGNSSSSINNNSGNSSSSINNNSGNSSSSINNNSGNSSSSINNNSGNSSSSIDNSNGDSSSSVEVAGGSVDKPLEPTKDGTSDLLPDANGLKELDGILYLHGKNRQNRNTIECSSGMNNVNQILTCDFRDGDCTPDYICDTFTGSASNGTCKFPETYYINTSNNNNYCNNNDCEYKIKIQFTLRSGSTTYPSGCKVR